MNLLALATLAVLSATPEKSLSTDVPMKARGWTVETAAVGGAAVVRGNDHVDVLAVVTDPETKKTTGVLLLQNVVVLANAAPAAGEARQLTLLVIPEESVLLATAKALGQLSVTLRHEQDVAFVEERATASAGNVLAGTLAPTAKKKK